MIKKIKCALVSVSDKTGLVPLVSVLSASGIKIISTGGTARVLREAGVPVTGVEEVTGFPEILDGRVKTLHPKIHAGILARSDHKPHLRQLYEHGIEPIDLVVVNLYPFTETISRERVTLAAAIENIDIGGPTMLRAAAKNYQSVAVIVNPARYESLVSEIREKGGFSEDTRFRLAAEAFAHTAHYDGAISNYLSAFSEKEKSTFPAYLNRNYKKVQDLRYGENPQQKAAFYSEADLRAGTVAAAEQLQGKPLSFNNINDLNAAWEAVAEFIEPAVVALKHTNPCGVGTATSIAEAYDKAYHADPVSIFGGVVAANAEIDAETARHLVKIFLEVVAAPSFNEEARLILAAKKNLRLLTIPLNTSKRELHDHKKVSGGLLVQELDTGLIQEKDWRVVTERKPVKEELNDLAFALKVVKHVKSNAIVIAKDGQTLGIGAGQMNRVGAVRIAVEQAGAAAGGSVLASDAFFPFKDAAELAAAAGVTAIVQPGGSLRDQESITFCNEQGLAMLFTGRRYFKH